MYKKAAENLFDITVRLPDSPLKDLHAYLIKGEDRNLLVDTGYNRPECLQCISEAFEAIGVSPENTDIFITHQHPDHLGLVPVLKRENTRVFMSRSDVKRRIWSCKPEINDLIRADLKLAGFPDNEIENNAFLSSKEALREPFLDYTPLDEGSILSYGGYEFETIATPGHCPGHMCLYDKRRRVLIAGDHVLFGITPNISRWVGVSDSLGDYVHSLMKIRDLEVEHLLCAHRAVTGTLAERVDEIIEHHGARVRETLDVLDAHPGTSAYELAGYMHWNISHPGGWDKFPLAQKPFAVYEVCAHLDYLLVRSSAEKQVRDGVEYYYPKK